MKYKVGDVLKNKHSTYIVIKIKYEDYPNPTYSLKDINFNTIFNKSKVQLETWGLNFASKNEADIINVLYR